MTQTLPISMLTLTADSTLKPDSSTASGFIADNQLSQSDADIKEQGSGFSALLNGMVQPAQSGKAGFSARQIPAAASGLSAISAAMLQATALDADSEDPDDTALANSLLLQIALKNHNGNATDAGDDSEVSASADEALAEDTAELTDTDATVAVPATDNDMAGDSLLAADDNAQNKITQKNSPVVIDAVMGAETENETAESSKAAKPVTAAEVTAASQQGGQPSGTEAAKPQAASSLHQTTEQLPITEGEAAEPVTQQQAAVQHVMQQRDISDSAAKPDASTTKVKTPVTAEATDSGAIRLVTAQQTTEPAAAGASAQAKVVLSSKSDDKNPATNTDTDKASAIKAQPASIVKNATADQGAQQQGQPQSERQFTTLEQPAGARSAADTATTRTENSFAANLQAADSRQQTQSSKTVVKTATEQLKQALNLQQHDAAGQLRERVNLMVRQNIQIAEIRLDPVGLGQMQIKVDMQQEQANVQFIVQQPQAKELLEQQLPRLREMLQQQGIVLGEGSVQQQSQQERQLAERQQQQQNGQGRQQASAEDGLSDDSIQTQLKVAPTDRLVDYYA